MRKIIRKVIEFAIALKDGAVVVVFLLASILRRPARQSGDVKTVWPGRVRAKGEPRPEGEFADSNRLDLSFVRADPLSRSVVARRRVRHACAAR